MQVNLELCNNQKTNSTAKCDAHQEVTIITVPTHPLGPGPRKGIVPTDSHVRNPNFTVEINMLTVWINKNV